jgi:hypothetical protein
VAGYRDIVGGSWEQKSVFAESVPHLFHYDMAYLWTLEQQADQRPRTWGARIEAWKLLLRMFFLDQLVVAPEDLRKPLLDLTERFGVRRITWLRSRVSNQAVGVLSPTVIVRPLPDFVDEDLDRWRAELKDNDRDFRHLLQVALQDLDRAAGTTPFATRIADVLRRELSPLATSQRPPGGRSVDVPLLHRLTWERRDGDDAPVTTVTLAVRSDKGGEIPEYIPRCLSCGALLLQEEHAPAIDVGAPVVDVLCANPQCAHPQQQLPLDAFGIWLRNATTAVAWSPEQIPPMPELQLPPAPDVVGNELHYEWNAAVIGGEHHRRYLRLRFPDRHIETVPLMSIFFSQLLIPGEFAKFNGSAVLPEWSDALNGTHPVSVRAVPEQVQIDFRDVEVHGWPLKFNKIYKALSLRQVPGLAAGIFPDPSLVGSGWKWFRAFVHGDGSDGYEVSCTDGRSVLSSSFASTESGLPRSVSVRSRADRATGVSYLPVRREAEDEYGGTANASMAIDFGTTNTIVYWQPPQGRQQQRRLVPRAETHGLDPRTMAKNALWFADSRAWSRSEVIASFLPGPGYRPTASDNYIIPSEVWRVGRDGFHLIRWGVEPPDPKAQFLPQFKWDADEPGEGTYTPTRFAFLRELVLQSLPAVIAAFSPVRVTDVKIGFAFPLAFEHEARAQFRRLLDSLAEDLTATTGLNVDMSPSINESKACVNAFGSFNGDTFLVADMGGGTLDVALFSYDPDGTMRQHQMGSLRYAGERCVDALAVQLGVPSDTNALREAIARGESAKKFGKQTAERVVTQFATIAFEFLRVMVAAYRKEHERPEEPIHVVLIGNGWHLMEAFSSEVRVRSGKSVYREVYADMVAALGDRHLVFYDKSPLSEFPSSKHLVVAGTLQNVTAQSTIDELREDLIALAKLPAGRSMEVAGQPMSWSELVGEGANLSAGLNLPTAREATIFIKVDEMPGHPPPSWLKRLTNSVGTTNGPLPYPTEPELLRELRHGLVGTPPKLKRGPLQLILELEWSQALSRRRGSVQ